MATATEELAVATEELAVATEVVEVAVPVAVAVEAMAEKTFECRRWCRWQWIIV